MAEAEEEASTLEKKNMANFVWHKFVTIKIGKRETRRGKERGAGERRCALRQRTKMKTWKNIRRKQQAATRTTITRRRRRRRIIYHNEDVRQAEAAHLQKAQIQRYKTAKIQKETERET